MATRTSDMAKLVARCRKAQWNVTASREGWIIRPPNGGRQISITRTGSSDRRALDNAIAMLNEAGLSQAEEKVKNEKLAANKARNAAAIRAAEQKGAALAAKAPTPPVSPYLTVDEEVPLEWFVTAHPAPWFRRVKMTVDIARELIDNYNNDNRPIDPKTVTHYRNIILAGLWNLTHQGGASNVKGITQDAQHRLLALLEANKIDPEITHLPFIWSVGWPVENFALIDEVRVRQARQLIAKDGIKNAGTIQTCVRLVHYMKDTNPRTAMREKLPNTVVLEFFGQAEDEYKDAVNWAVSSRGKIRGSIASALAAGRFLLRRDNGYDNAYVERFLSGVASGVYPNTRQLLEDDDPRATFRKRLADADAKKTPVTGMTQLGMMITAWNNCVRGKTPRSLIFTEETPIPQILRCQPGDGATPHAFTEMIV
jgi:hypothetical protein